MDKVRFACPRCHTTMQTGAEKVGYDVACPHCAHRFRLIESSDSSVSKPPSDLDAATLPPSASPIGPGPSSTNALRSQATNPATSSALPVSQMPKPVPQAGFCCPYCQTRRPPIWKSEVSQVGWIVFAILLVTTCVFCFVGLFIRDKYRICSQCRIRLG